jgi:hypothetical protein
MKVVKDKTKDNEAEQTYSLCGLSVKDLKCVRAGLEMFWTQTNNNRAKLMAADITAGALKDPADKYADDADPKKVREQNKAVLRTLGKYTPTEFSEPPISASLRQLKYK